MATKFHNTWINVHTGETRYYESNPAYAFTAIDGIQSDFSDWLPIVNTRRVKPYSGNSTWTRAANKRIAQLRNKD